MAIDRRVHAAMQIDLTRYRQPTTHIDRTFEPAEVEQPGDAYRIVAPVHVVVDLHRDKEHVRLAGSTTTELELSCSRCTEPFRLSVAATFDLRFEPASAMTTEADREVDPDDIETGYYRDDQIDLNEILREQYYLALPMKPLCDEACRGLCPQCGINLNTGTCDCSVRWEDPRLAALQQFKRES